MNFIKNFTTSMNQETKDTIREEWYKHNLSHQTQTADNFKDYVADWWLNKLDQAYQQGAKDSLNRVKNAKTTLVNPDFPVVVNIIVDTVARGMNINLKDNT